MDGFSWLILSWIVVGALCYFLLNKLGAPQTESSYAAATTTAQYSTTPGAPSSDWTNELLAWLHANMHRVPEPLDAWINSLNEAAKKVSSPSKCEILFEGFGDNSHVKVPPKVSKIQVERGPRDHLTMKSIVDVAEVNLKLVSSQRVEDRLLVSNFDAKIRDLHGEIEARVACIANQIYLMGCFTGRPELDIELTNTDSSSTGEVSSAIVEESIRRCFVSAVTNIALSETLSTTPHPPPDERQTSAVAAPVQEMMKRLNQSHLIAPTTNLSTLPNKLRVKVIRAQRLGRDSDVSQPYVVVEMDEPAKKYTTSKGLNMSPYWEEVFDFELTPASEEILFEIYEGAKATQDEEQRFLGLAIVGFEEIRRSGESIHCLALQGRPYRNDNVSGTLTVQFDFYFDPTVATIGKQVDQITVRNNDGAEFRETVTTSRRPIYDPHDSFDSHDIIPTKTTTVLVKTVSQEKPLISSVHGSLENAMDPATARSLETTFQRQFIDDSYDLQRYEGPSLVPTQTILSEPRSQTIEIRTQQQTQEDPNRQSRDRTKKPRDEIPEKRDRSFFGELKDRLSGRRRSKGRAKSLDVGNEELEEAVSLPPSRDQSQTRYNEKPISRSHYDSSSVGAKSGESSKSLYQHSTLVLETTKNNQKKYFLIPPSIVNEPAAARLMKRGKKLHIYNEHTFVAVKLRGGTVCNVCHHRIARSFSKQAYQCRDCRLVCHKSCHYKTESYCTASTVSNLEISKDIDWAHFLSHYQLEEYISVDGI